MSRQTWTEQINQAIVADGTAIANSTTETIIFPNITVPANYLSDGRLLRLVVMGRHSTTGTPTLTFRVRLGGVSGTVVVASGAMTCGSGVTAAMFKVEVWIQVRTNGATGTVLGVGEAILGEDASSTVGSATNAAAHDFMGSAGVATPAAVTVDLTADQALAVSAQWSAASASNTLTGHVYALQSLN